MSDTESKKRNFLDRKIPNKWDPQAERLFLELWLNKMDKLLSCRKNSHILLEMELELEEAGFNHKLMELKTKMHNMSAKFRKERKLYRKSGVPSDWEHYEAMQHIMSLYKNRMPADSPDDEEYDLVEEVEWKPKIYKMNSDNDDNLNSLEDISQQSENISTSISFVSVPENEKNPINPLNAQPASKRVKNTSSSVMGLEERDDIDLFFLTMAKTVRKLPYLEQVNIKQTVSNIVFQAEIKNISNNSS